MPKTWIEWEPLDSTDTLPAGEYDLKLYSTDRTDEFITEIRGYVFHTMPASELDALMSRNMEQPVYVRSAKLVPAELHNKVIMLATDYDTLLKLATDRAENRAERQILFRIAGRARRIS